MHGLGGLKSNFVFNKRGRNNNRFIFFSQTPMMKKS